MPERDVVLGDIIEKLRTPIADAHMLLPLLCFPLDAVGLLPPQYRQFATLSSNASFAVNVTKVFLVLQHIFLETILPTWGSVLEEEGWTPLAQQYFCPDVFVNASVVAGDVALCAYSTVLSRPINQCSVDLLHKLTMEYPIDRLYRAVATVSNIARRSVAWDGCLRDVFAVPSKVANALAGQGIPSQLGMPDYIDNLCLRCDALLHELSKSFGPDDISFLTQLFVKLVNVGAFPSSTYTPPSQPSFFRSAIPLIRSRLRRNGDVAQAYERLWNSVVSSLPSMLTQKAIIASLLASLPSLESPLGTSASDRGVIWREASLLRHMLGELLPDADIWQAAISVILTRTWSRNHARVFVCWVAQSRDTEVSEQFLSSVIDAWSTPDHIKFSLLSQHHYVSILLLLSITHFPHSSGPVMAVALSPPFISAIGQYISHPDNSIRRCGMLVAEMVASRAGKTLDFGDWDGHEGGRGWARDVRELCAQRDVDFEASYDDDEFSQARDEPVSNVAEKIISSSMLPTPEAVKAISLGVGKVTMRHEAGYDSDDSLIGYASPSSSRSPSPTPSELEEIEKDPTLRIGVRKIPRPVYLTQLGELVRGTSGLKSNEENQEANKIEMAINVGEDLIRRKRDFGTELAENAANLVYGFLTLNNNYELEGFDDKRQRIMVALVVCCPKIAAPCVIEEYFKNQYSTDQRFVMSNALVLGARELASLPAYRPKSQSLAKPSFPSRVLPPALHQKYLAGGSQSNIRLLLDNITQDIIDKGREATADKLPELVRERQLRIRKPAKVSEVVQRPSQALMLSQPNPSSPISYTEVAAEYFIMPFINRFWVFLRDEQTREERTAHRDVLFRYHGAGTGLILNSLVLSHFLTTIAVTVHAARNASQWLAIIAPEALELAVTLGSRQLSKPVRDLDESTSAGASEKGREASILTSALELALVVLDGSVELDSGRTLGLEHTTLLLAVGEWAGKVFNQLNSGNRVEGGGGAHEIKLLRAAVGVVLKTDEFTSQWRRSMVDVR